MDIIIKSIILGLMVAWVIAFATKTGLREWAEVHAPCDLLNELIRCDFCLSWWLSLVFTFVLYLYDGFAWGILAVPFLSTMIARKFL